MSAPHVLVRIDQVGVSLQVVVSERIVGEGNLKIDSTQRLSITRCVFDKTAVMRLRELWQVRRRVSVLTSRRETVESLDNKNRRK